MGKDSLGRSISNVSNKNLFYKGQSFLMDLIRIVGVVFQAHKRIRLREVLRSWV